MNELIERAKRKGYNFLEYRSIKNYIAEWYIHNLLYRLHLFRKHTKDVDFQRQFKHTFRDTIEKIIYKIIELFKKRRKYGRANFKLKATCNSKMHCQRI